MWHQLNVQSSSDWTARQGHAAVALKQSIYLMGGFGEVGYCNSCYQGCNTKVYLPVQISKSTNSNNENDNSNKDTVQQDDNVITFIKYKCIYYIYINYKNIFNNIIYYRRTILKKMR